MSSRGLRPADELLLPAVRTTAKALELAGPSRAALRLAEQYAQAIDGAAPEERVAVLRELGPKLLAVLAELGATPRSRAALLAGGEPDVPVGRPGPAGGGSQLAKLRASSRRV